MPKRKRKSPSESEDSDSDEEEQFQVEVVTRAKLNEDGEWEYFVSWAGYGSDADSWEPQSHLTSCKRLLDSFWDHIGRDNADYPPGYATHTAGSDWIRKEKEYFARELALQEREKLQTKARKLEKKRAKKKEYRSEAVTKTKTSKLTSNVASSSTKGIGKTKQMKRNRAIATSDSDGSDDVPLHRSVSTSKKTTPDGENDAPKTKLKKTHSTPTIVAQHPDKGKGKAAEAPSQRPTLHVKTSVASDMGKGTASDAYVLMSSPAGSLFSRDSPEHSPSSPEIPLNLNSTNVVFATASSSKSIPAHVERRTNPKVKLMEAVPPSRTGPNSALSTKNRISQGANVAQPHRPVVKYPSFKKIKNVDAPSPVEPRKPPRIDTHTSPPSFTSQTSGIMADCAHVVASPLSAHNFMGQDPMTTVSPTEPFMPPYETRRRSSINDPMTASRSDRLHQEAEQFLSDIMPLSLSGPLSESVDSSGNPSRHLPKPVTLGRIPKKWKWSGELFIDISSEQAERLCEVSLSEPTDHLPDGLRFSIFIDSLDSLRLKKVYDVADLPMLLPAWGPSHQFALVGPQEDKDADAFKVFVTYMQTQELFSAISLSFTGSDETQAVLLVFPTTSDVFCDLLKVPAYLQRSKGLLVAIVPWLLRSDAYHSERWRELGSCPAWIPRTFEGDQSIANLNTVLRKDPSVYRALQLLKFPKPLFDHVSKYHRTFCIWPSSQPLGSDLETSALLTILGYCQAEDKGLKADVHIVFVHIGALSTIGKLPALAERRTRRPEIQFFTYGTHNGINPERWGIHEIYPLGGIVTFTPKAILEDPFGAHSFIQDVARHPIWECYVLPSVMGMVAKLACGDMDPVSLHDKNEFSYSSFFALVEEGELSLLHSPPAGDPNTNHRSINWIEWQLSAHEKKSRDFLQDCLRVFFGRQESDLGDLDTAIEAEIAADLTSIQMQPVIMDNYRRYVVIRAASESHIKWDKGGFEWTTLAQFNFKDDFHSKPSPVEKKKPPMTEEVSVKGP